jgi:hypothetical protein
MTTNAKLNRQQSSGSHNKSASGSKGVKDNDYPNIIEEPIRVVGDETSAKSRAAKAKKQSAKSGKTASNSRKKKRT